MIAPRQKVTTAERFRMQFLPKMIDKEHWICQKIVLKVSYRTRSQSG